MFAIQNAITISSLIISCILFFSISGQIVLKHPKLNSLEPLQQFSLSFIFGGIFLSLICLFAKLFNLTNQGIQGTLIVLIISQLAFNFRAYLQLVSKSWPIIVVWILYSTICVCFEVNNGVNIQAFKLSDVQSHFNLPVDNLLQFQVVRYLTEGISPLTIDPVPNWKFGDRGPLMGLLISNVFFLFGLIESSTWLNSSYPAAFVYESIAALLNSFFLLAVYSAGRSYFGKTAGILAIALLIINPFVYINVVFTWPKFFAAGLALFSIELLFLINQPLFFLSAMLLGLSFLVHEGLLFCLPAIFCAIIYRFGFKKLIYFLSIFFVIQIPWTLFKTISNQISNSVVAHNLLCLEVGTTNEVGIFKLIKNEIENKGIASLLGIRVRNFIYPLDFSYIDWKTELLKANPLIGVSYAITGITFYQFIYALGFVLVLFFLGRLAFNFKNLNPALAAFGLTLFSVALFQGCELSTWNHIWCYLPLIMLTLVVARELVLVPRYVSLTVVLLHGVFSVIVLARYLRIIV